MHGQLHSSAHCSTSRCPLRAAARTGHRVPRTAVLPRPPQDLEVPNPSGNAHVHLTHGQSCARAKRSTSRSPPLGDPCAARLRDPRAPVLLSASQPLDEAVPLRELERRPPRSCPRAAGRRQPPPPATATPPAREHGEIRGLNPRQHLRRKHIVQALEQSPEQWRRVEVISPSFRSLSNSSSPPSSTATRSSTSTPAGHTT